MSESTLQTQIAAAEAYDAHLVPFLTRKWAPIVADAARILPGERVLDVACGTGVLAREVATRVIPDGVVTGIDASAGMLEVARRLAPTLDWREGVAESLPFADGSFDAVVSQFGLMFFNDRHEAIRQALRVLGPDGRLVFAVWDALENIPAYAAEVALLERTAGREAADVVREPFSLGNRSELTEIFEEAGVRSLEVRTEHVDAHFPSIGTMMEVDLLGWLPRYGFAARSIVLSDDVVTEILDEAERVFAPFVGPDGSVVFDLSAHIVSGTSG